MEDPLENMQAFSTAADAKGGQIAPYLVNLLLKIINKCLLKQTKRPTSEQVCCCANVKDIHVHAR